MVATKPPSATRSAKGSGVSKDGTNGTSPSEARAVFVERSVTVKTCPASVSAVPTARVSQRKPASASPPSCAS